MLYFTGFFQKITNIHEDLKNAEKNLSKYSNTNFDTFFIVPTLLYSPNHNNLYNIVLRFFPIRL